MVNNYLNKTLNVKVFSGHIPKHIGTMIYFWLQGFEHVRIRRKSFLQITEAFQEHSYIFSALARKWFYRILSNLGKILDTSYRSRALQYK